MSEPKRVDMIVSRVPPALKAAVEAEAERRGISVSDAAVEKLAAEFGIDYEARPLSRSMPDVRRNPAILYLSMPRTLRRRIKARAAGHDTTPSAVMRAILTEHYDLVSDAA